MAKIQRVKEGQVHTMKMISFALLVILATCFILHAGFNL